MYMVTEKVYLLTLSVPREICTAGLCLRRKVDERTFSNFFGSLQRMKSRAGRTFLHSALYSLGIYTSHALARMHIHTHAFPLANIPRQFSTDVSTFKGPK